MFDYQWILDTLQNFGKYSVGLFFRNKIIAIPCTAIVTVFCFAANAIMYPEGFINSRFIWMIDMIAAYLPSTPEHYKIGTMLVAFSEQSVIPLGVVYEIFQGVAGILAIYLVVKMYKFLPFT